ncbi:MAG: AAA family ATPase [Snowella sp.]|nr:AAA family ATPase [Snowella sp.]
MKIKVKNLGVLKQAEFELGDFTIICGENNTGKTYATYALFGFLYTWKNFFEMEIGEDKVEDLMTKGTTSINIADYVEKIQDFVDQGCQKYIQELPNIFATNKEKFQGSSFQVIIEEKDVFQIQNNIQTTKFEPSIDVKERFVIFYEKSLESNNIIINFNKKEFFDAESGDAKFRDFFISLYLKIFFFPSIFHNHFIISSERTGAAIFRKELNFARSKLLEKMSRADSNNDLRGILYNAYEDYALPIKTNLDFLQNLSSISKKSSFIAENYPDILDYFADIIGGKYTINDNDQLYYEPKGKRLKLTMDESSSAVRSLLDLSFYLRHEAKPGDLLIIDEPELNLHPENQRRVARLLARLVNLGIKVFITTHSDYIIKELNTLIMLNHDKPHLKRIAEVEGYQQNEFLNADQIKVYIAEEAPVLLDGKTRKTKCQTLTPADINPEMGIEARSFDKTIDTMNRIQEEIVWGAD